MATRPAQAPESAEPFRRLAFGIIATISLSSCVLIAVIAYLGWVANKNEQRSERALIENALTQSVVHVLDELKGGAWWDDAVKKTEDSFDVTFLDGNFGTFYTQIFNYDAIYILDARNEPIYGFAKGKRLDPASFRTVEAAFAGVVGEARGTPERLQTRRVERFTLRQNAKTLMSGALGQARWGAKVTLLNGQLAIVAAISIVPDVDPGVLKGTPYLLLSTVRIDDAFLDKLGESLLISDLRLSQAATTDGATVAEPFVTDDGQDAGYLSWRTARPGHPILTVILPLVLFGVVGMWLLSASMLRRLSSASTKLSRNEASARYDAEHDALSGLPNRNLFLQRLAQALQAGRKPREASVIAVGYLDIDRFKDINDTSGHAVGDKLIEGVGLRLSRHLGRQCFIARFGGDEFALFKPLRDAGEAAELGRDALQAFDKPLVIDGVPIKVTASLGIACSLKRGADARELMRRADIALYAAKKAGRNQAASFDAAMARQVSERREIEIDLRKALDSEGLELYFQPIVDARTASVGGVEVLVRWHHPTKGTISPSVFIPIAEEAGLMCELGNWILEQAVTRAARLGGLWTAINLSPAQLQQCDFPSLLEKVLAKAGVDPGSITLEITEGMLLDRSPNTLAALSAIRRLGCKIALDDFGTGFSSLQYLMNFRFDKLKIDRSFVTGSSDAATTRAIVRSVIQLGRALKMEVVAEGVETKFDAALMQALGCDHLQGYLFSKALPFDELNLFIERYHQSNADTNPGVAPKDVTSKGR